MTTLIFSCSTGEGHNSAARAIKSCMTCTARIAQLWTRCRFFLKRLRNSYAAGIQRFTDICLSCLERDTGIVKEEWKKRILLYMISLPRGLVHWTG